MNRYTIYCTPEQTKKALELGAPIINYPLISSPYGIPKFEEKGIAYIIPTAEQMIGWIEEQGFQFNIHTNMFNEWEVLAFTENTDNTISEVADSDWKETKIEAILAAIDAALEYLTNKKK